MAQLPTSCALALWEPRLAMANRVPRGATVLESTYTEAEPRPGTPARVGKLLARVYGDQQSDVSVRVESPGTGRRTGAKVSISTDGGLTQLSRMREAEVSRWELWEAAGIGKRWNALGACVTATGRPVVAAGAANDSEARYFDGTTWQTAAGLSASGFGSEGVGLATDPVAGTVICCRWDGTDLRVYHSNDDAQSFDQVSTSQLTVAKSTSRMALGATSSGLLMLLQADDASGDVYQFASGDQGLTWTEIGSIAAEGLGWAIPTYDEAFYVHFYAVSGADAGKLHRTVVTSPWVPVWDQSSETITGRVGLKAIAGWVDRSGMLYTAVVDSGQFVAQQFDGRDTDEHPISFSTLSTSVGPRNMVGAHSRYGAFVVHNGASPGAPDQDDSVHIMWLGGWSSLEWGSLGTFANPATLWLPHAQPTADAVWTKTGGGTATLGDGLELAGEAYYTRSLAGSADPVFLDVELPAAGDLTALVVGARIRWVTGSTARQIQVRLDTTGFRIRDALAVSNLATVAVEGGAGTRIQIRVDRFSLWWRYPTSAAWTEVPHNTSTDSSGGTSSVDLGNFSAGPTSKWYGFGHSQAGIVEEASFVGAHTPTWLPPEVGDPASLQLLDGPGFIGDEGTVEVSAAYPVDALDPVGQPSPSVRWRSTQSAVAEDIVFDLGVASLIGKSVVLGLAGSLVRRVRLSRYDDDAGAWEEAVEVDLAAGFVDLSFDRDGDILRPAADTITAGRYLQPGELRGGFAILPGDTCKRILDNGGGMWAQGSEVVPWVRIEDDTPAILGNVTLVAPGGVAVASPGQSPSVRFWRVRVPIQPLPDGVAELGTVFVGRLAPFGAEPDWTWTDEDEPNDARSESPYGTIRSRVIGPPRRSWTWGWGDQVMLRDLRSGDPSRIDGVGVPGGQSIVAAEEVWWTLRDVLQTHQGLPIFALRDVLQTHQGLPIFALRVVPGDGETITDPSLWLYGLLDGSVAFRGVVGYENRDEVLRGDSITVVGQR